MKLKLTAVFILFSIGVSFAYAQPSSGLQKGDSACVLPYLLYDEAAYMNLQEEGMYIVDCYPKCDFCVVRNIQDSIINLRVFRNGANEYYLFGIFNMVRHPSLPNALLFQGKQIFFHPGSSKVKEVRFYNNQHLLVQAEQTDEDGNVRQKMSRAVTDFYNWQKYDADKQLVEECTCKYDTSDCEKTIYINTLKRSLQEGVELPQTRKGTMKEVCDFTIADLTVDDLDSEEPLFVIVEDMPEFPGGQQGLFNYLSANVKYPIEAQKNGIQGRVICQFIVNKDGSIVDVTVLHSGGDPSLDKEALRVIKGMPNWKPGKLRGKFVRVKYTLPVNFRLN